MYTKDISLCKGLKAGYLIFYDSAHPLAHADGSVYYHRHQASLMLGRWLSTDEHVHHIDCNKLNNTLSNLQVLSPSEHSKLHAHTTAKTIKCMHCEAEFTPLSQSKAKSFCSQGCYKEYCVKDKSITKELLDKLIPTHTWVELGKLFGYSDNGIKKRAKALGCTLPSRRRSQ